MSNPSQSADAVDRPPLAGTSGKVEHGQRPSFFALHYTRLLADVQAANRIGMDGCWLLTVIVTAQDRFGYRPVEYRPGQLLLLLGCGSEDSLERLRKRLVTAGWLGYRRGRRRVPGSYWVEVPPEHRGKIKEWMDSPQPAVNPAPERDHTRIPRPGAEETAGRSAGRSAGTSLLFPSPDPKREEKTPPNPPKGGEVVLPAAEKRTKRKRKRKREQTADPPEPPESVLIPAAIDTPEFRTHWSEWLAERRERKKSVPLTARAARLQLATLSKLGEQAAIEAINNSIANGWPGVYAPKHSAGGRPGEDKYELKMREILVKEELERHRRTGVVIEPSDQFQPKTKHPVQEGP